MVKLRSKLSIILIVLASILFSGCDGEEEKIVPGVNVRVNFKRCILKMRIPKGVRKTFFVNYMDLYLEKWESFKVDHPLVERRFKEYFGGAPYRVIWKWDTDGDDKIDYLGVEEYPGIYKGIERGILISEDGEIKMYIDRDKGFYTPTYKVYDFERIGFKKGEIECIRLLFINDEMKFTSKQLKSYKEASKEPSNSSLEVGEFDFQLLDKDLKVITHWDDENAPYIDNMIWKLLWQKDWKIYYIIYNPNTVEEEYELEKSILNEYRVNKSKGLVYDPINFDPDKMYEELNKKKWYEFWR
ncbi:hypothetical protein [Thermospira aquatica]|uniref:Lipoprotein n=1 Tax=Thermospira aquatica TaxID=2828656 RepID=A0AAX3BED2_9SPIR|nr:hypothetical protein [Thermospira aquatica]URA10667.1 hypothetical protein KDW03_02355 [Thermospira aquatica]